MRRQILWMLVQNDLGKLIPPDIWNTGGPSFACTYRNAITGFLIRSDIPFIGYTNQSRAFPLHF